MGHITLIIGYTVISLLRFNIKSTDGNDGNFSALTNGLASLWTCFGGVADIFLSCILWFILDIKKSPDLITDGRHHSSYAVLDIIKKHESNRSSGLNSEDEEDDVTVEGRLSYRPHSVKLSDRMIAQFLVDEVEEGPDRNWFTENTHHQSPF